MTGKRSLYRLAVVVIVVLLVPLYALAEYWLSTASDLLQHARIIEVVRVDSVNQNQWNVHVEQPIRSNRRPGTRFPIHLEFAPIVPNPNDQLLVICDNSMCPRAIGVEHHGAWFLHAFEPGDGAAVIPSIVETRSLSALMSGGTPSPICIRVSGNGLPTPTISLSVDARNGTTTVTSAGNTFHGSVSIPNRQQSMEDLTVTINTPTRTAVNIHVDRRDPTDGCLVAHTR